jgi:hypothetical protein
MLRMRPFKLLEDCAIHSNQPLKVKGSRWLNAIFINLAGLWALGECFSLPQDAWLPAHGLLSGMPTRLFARPHGEEAHLRRLEP